MSGPLVPLRLGALRAAKTPLVGIVIVALVSMAIPNIVSAFWLRALLSSVVFTLPALGVSLLFGRLSIASLSQVALVAVGGWVSLRVAHGADLPFIVSMLCGGAAAAFVGAVIGLPALRVHGLFLTLVTLLAAGGIEKVLITTGFPDGGPGFLGRDTTGDRVSMPRPAVATSDAAYFRYLVAIAALCFAVVAVVRLGRYGRMWAIIGQGEAAAAAAGVNVLVVRTAAFSLAGFLSGIAGCLLAGTVGFLNPASFGASESVLLFALALAAGTKSLSGPVVAALLYRAVPSLFDQVGIPGDVATIVFGLLLIHAMLGGGGGLTGQLGQTLGSRRMESSPPTASEVEDPSGLEGAAP